MKGKQNSRLRVTPVTPQLITPQGMPQQNQIRCQLAAWIDGEDDFVRHLYLCVSPTFTVKEAIGKAEEDGIRAKFDAYLKKATELENLLQKMFASGIHPAPGIRIVSAAGKKYSLLNYEISEIANGIKVIFYFMQP